MSSTPHTNADVSQQEDAAAFWERVRIARSQSPEEKLLAGIRMFDEECKRRRLEIRSNHPSATDVEIERILVEQIEEERRLDEGDRYRPVPPDAQPQR